MKATTKSTIHTIAIFLILALVITGCGNARSEKQTKTVERTRVTIAYLPVVHGLPLYLALEKGYFEEEGITVEAIKFDSPNLILQALVAGQVDFGAPSTAAGITAIADHANPGKLKIYALTGSANADTNGEAVNEALIVKKGSSIMTIQDLQGKKVAILPSIQWRTITRHIFAKNDLSVDSDVTLVELGPGMWIQALTSGQVDAVMALEPVVTTANLQGISREIEHGIVEKYVADPMYAGAGVLRVDFARANPETTAKVLRVFAQATEEINRNPEAAKKYLVGYTPLDAELASKMPPIVIKMYPDLTEEDITALQQFYDIFSEYKVIDSRVNASTLIYRP